MKLTKELKERIDKYFEQISADELYKILTKKYHMPKIKYKIMNNLLKEIEKYFQNTSKDQLQKDWNELKEYNNVGPSVAEYLSSLCSKVWMYNGTKYSAFKTDWSEFGKTKNYDLLVNPITVYNPDWDKCYYLEMLGYHGHGNKLKAYIRDVYDESKHHWVEARKLEIVRKLN